MDNKRRKIFISVIVWTSYGLGCYNLLWNKDYVWGIGWFMVVYIVLFIYNKR